MNKIAHTLRTIFLTLPLLIALNSPALAQEEDSECILSKEALNTPFNIDNTDAKTIESKEHEPHDMPFNHTIKLTNGAVVSYSAGGCAHYRQFINVTHAPFDMGEKLDDATLQNIITFLQTLPFKDDDKYLLDGLTYMQSNKDNPDAQLCNDCDTSSGQINIVDDNGTILTLTIEDKHSFSFVSDFPL